VSSTAEPSMTGLSHAIDTLEIAFPAPGTTLDQDEEWVVVRVDGEWRRIRLHDYPEVFSVPGLYEKWIYDVLECQSPRKIRERLHDALESSDVDPASLTVFDLGAGNGCVADELRAIGIRRFVGVDLHPEAAMAAERDRPGLYDDYVVGDLTDLDEDKRRKLDRYDFNCLTCVAALGFGDIPPEVFLAAYERLADGGWAAFTVKDDFLEESDQSGFSILIRRLLNRGLLELVSRESYVHRISGDGTELSYTAFIGRRLGPVPSDILD